MLLSSLTSADGKGEEVSNGRESVLFFLLPSVVHPREGSDADVLNFAGIKILKEKRVNKINQHEIKINK